MYKDIVESAMISTPKGYINNSLLSPSPFMTVKNTSAIKSFHNFSEVLDTKPHSVVHTFGAAKSRLKSVIVDIMICSSIQNRGGHTKTNEQVKKIFIIIIYSILRLFSPQLQMIVLNFPLTVTPKHSW